MHPMPREGTETLVFIMGHCHIPLKMHPMPREGTETEEIYILVFTDFNASYAP